MVPLPLIGRWETTRYRETFFKRKIVLWPRRVVVFASMFYPKPANIPSESTIEVLTNHFILHSLNDPSAWIVCPTRNEEKLFGYDASIQHSKLAIIQYKRVRHFYSNNEFTVSLNAKQHNTLLTNFRRLRNPYVFYCFSRYRDYARISDDFARVGAPFFFQHSLFVNAHDILINSTSVKLFANGLLKARLGGKYRPINYMSGPQFIREVKNCTLGESGATLLESRLDLNNITQRGVRRPSVLNYPMRDQLQES